MVDPEPDRRIALVWRRGMKAAFLLGRSLSRRQKAELGFIRGTTPCHATLTETLRVIDAQALADVLGALFLEEGGNGASHRHRRQDDAGKQRQ